MTDEPTPGDRELQERIRALEEWASTQIEWKPRAEAAEARMKASEDALQSLRRNLTSALGQCGYPLDHVLVQVAERVFKECYAAQAKLDRLRAAGEASEAKVRELVAENEQLAQIAKDRLAAEERALAAHAKLDRLRAAAAEVTDGYTGSNYELWSFANKIRAAAEASDE